MHDPAQIARSLSKPQRALIMRGSAGGDESTRTIESAIRKGLMHLRIASPDGRHGFVETTDLGKQVAAIIRKDEAW